jgi:multiple antibiotic resistance protein
MENYVGEFLIFFATIDPIGTLALFVGLTAGVAAKERRSIAFRSIGYAAVILVASMVAGQLLLGALGIRLAAFELAGGLIFFLFGVQMVFGFGAAGPSSPLAVPSIASPGSILAAVVLTDNREFSVAEQVISGVLLLAVLGLTLILLLQASRIHRLIGDAGSTLMVRVLGLILAALAVEMVLSSITELMLKANSA